MDDVQRAFKEWQESFPAKKWVEKQSFDIKDQYGQVKTITEPAHWDGECCWQGHFTKNADGFLAAKTDDKVCARERAWRKYVRLRDGIDALH